MRRSGGNSGSGSTKARLARRPRRARRDARPSRTVQRPSGRASGAARPAVAAGRDPSAARAGRSCGSNRSRYPSLRRRRRREVVACPVQRADRRLVRALADRRRRRCARASLRGSPRHPGFRPATDRRGLPDRVPALLADRAAGRVGRRCGRAGEAGRDPWRTAHALRLRAEQGVPGPRRGRDRGLVREPARFGGLRRGVQRRELPRLG